MEQGSVSIYSAYIAVVQTMTMMLIAIIGYFVKRTIDDFSRKLESHDTIIFTLTGQVQRLIGRQEVWDGITNRRQP